MAVQFYELTSGGFTKAIIEVDITGFSDKYGITSFCYWLLMTSSLSWNSRTDIFNKNKICLTLVRSRLLTVGPHHLCGNSNTHNTSSARKLDCNSDERLQWSIMYVRLFVCTYICELQSLLLLHEPSRRK